MDTNNHEYGRENLEKWLGVWEQALKDGAFQTEEPKEEKPLNIDPHLAQMAGIDVDLLQETKTPNPVYPDSLGKDQENPKPVWVDENMLKEIEQLKNKLFDLENKLAKEEADDKAQSLMKKIESIRKDIDDVSDVLGIENEPSPWEYKKNEKL